MVTASARQRRLKIDVRPAEEAQPALPVEEAQPEASAATSEPPKPVLPEIYASGMSSEGFIPAGNIEVVDCPLFPGLDLKVKYNTSVSYRMIREDYEGPGGSEIEKVCRKQMAIVAGFENWAFIDPMSHRPIPEPNHYDWESWLPLYAASGWLTDLGDWIRKEGLLLALAQTLGN